MPRLTTRDYKRSSRSPGASKLREFGLGVLVGAALASAAFLIAGAHARHRAAVSAHAHPGVTSQSAAPAPAAPDAGPGSSPSKAATRTGGSGSARSSSETASSATQAPQYDFYRMLPRLDVPVPHADAHGAPPPKPAAAPPARPSGSGPAYILQVGSYLRSAEAEQVRARLARVGLSAQIDRVVAGSRTWHRVRIGPVSGAALARARAQLQTANLHALTIRVGP